MIVNLVSKCGKNGQLMSACANYLTGICMHYNDVHHSQKSALPWNMDKNWCTKVRGSGEKRMMEHCVKTGTMTPCRKQARYLSKKDQMSIATHLKNKK